MRDQPPPIITTGATAMTPSMCVLPTRPKRRAFGLHHCDALVPCVHEAAASPRGRLRDGRTSPAHLRAGSRSHVTSHVMASYHDTVGIPGTCQRAVAWSVGRMSCIRVGVTIPVESAARWAVGRKTMLHRLQSNGGFLVRSESRTSTKCSHRSMGFMRTSPQRGVSSTSA